LELPDDQLKELLIRSAQMANLIRLGGVDYDYEQFVRPWEEAVVAIDEIGPIIDEIEAAGYDVLSWYGARLSG
jgi:hypothetical protein